MEVDLGTVAPSADEAYIIAQVQKMRSADDPCSAKSWIITAKTLYPNNFNVQFEAYKLEKEANNYQEAAKCFSYITLTFQNQTGELWNEVNDLTTALRSPENEITLEQEFYVKMFQHVQQDVQHKILLLTVNHTENSLNQCKLLLLVLKRFPKAAVTHSPRLLEMIADGMKQKQHAQKYQEMLIDEALPLIYHKTPDLSASLVCRLFITSLEYYMRQINDETVKCDTNETWKRIFQVLMLCGRILRWETFLPFNKTWGQNVYWDKLFEIVSTCAAGSTQVLYYATTLFIYSLHCYIKNCTTTRPDDGEINHVLVEGFSDWALERSDPQSMEPPQISLTTPTSKEISKAFVHAAQCWQLLNTEQFQRDFSKLLHTLPLTSWISRFLFDLAIYFGHQEEAKKLMADMSVNNNLVQNLQLLSLNLLQGNCLTLQGFECVLIILGELPTLPGQVLDHLTLKVPRHMIFIPLMQKPLVQYCTKALTNSLSRKLYEPNCPDRILGDLLVLLQLEYPRDSLMAEQIFGVIANRRSFTYHQFSAYIVCIDFIEEFMHIWRTHNEEFNFDLSPPLPLPSSATASGATGSAATPTGGGNHSSSSAAAAGVSTSPAAPGAAAPTPAVRRIGTRGADKGQREEFRLLIKQQIARANENISALVATFITQEHRLLLQHLFGAPANNNANDIMMA